MVGGGVVGVLLTDPAAPDARGTKDADAVVRVGSRARFHWLEEALRAQGWTPDTSPDAPICRWHSPDGDMVDLMPDDPDVLGFANPWYGLALDTRTRVEADGGGEVFVVWAPVFVLTKLVAFENRGQGDVLGSHDLEDIVAIFDGRPELDDEMLRLPREARAYAAEAIGRLLAHRDLVFALPGHVDPTSDTERRAAALHARWQRLARHLDAAPET